MRAPVKYLLMRRQCPLLVRTGFKNWNKKTVPVGRSLMRSPTPVYVRSLMALNVFDILDNPLVVKLGFSYRL
uniref:Uncharacterized protein n=1 Tax=Noccaea caerulescens TaxID=107243 RepID=A0A1J3GJI2_NOCCA